MVNVHYLNCMFRLYGGSESEECIGKTDIISLMVFSMRRVETSELLRKCEREKLTSILQHPDKLSITFSGRAAI